MHQLCNKLSDHTFKIEKKKKRKEKRKRGEKTTEKTVRKQELFPPFNDFAGLHSVSQTNNDKSVGLIYLCCAKNGERSSKR